MAPLTLLVVLSTTLVQSTLVGVLADSAHPLILKSVLEGNVFQMVRADLPDNQPAKRGAPADSGLLEEELANLEQGFEKPAVVSGEPAGTP